MVLLDEYERWTGDRRLVRELEHEARAALNWIDEYADLLGNGYVWYQRRNEKTGLENQCWKDSWDSISYRDGTAAGLPAGDLRAPGLRLRREGARRPPRAPRLEGPRARRPAGAEAADLKRRFNRDFWVEDGEYFALALDTDGNQVDALASNNGHLLWSGIVDKSKAQAVARHLLGPRLFSGWGVRTLAEGEGRYNPIGYHVGTVWPFDNSFIAWGLRRYGFKEEAAQIAAGILDAAEFFARAPARGVRGLRADGRRSTRSSTRPRAARRRGRRARRCCSCGRCSGSSRSASTSSSTRRCRSDIGHLELLDIPGRWGRIDAFGRGRVDVDSQSDRRRSGATRRRRSRREVGR